jgi:Ca2+:H+ antiporter
MAEQSQYDRDTAKLLSREDRVLFGLLVFVVAALVAGRLGAPAWLRFLLSVVAVVPLAGLIGSATEALAARLGARAGGLLNATFGNAPDLLIGVFGVQRNLIPLVKATLIGALISNSALIMGLCYAVAGLRHGRLTFRRAEAGHHSVLMMLTLAAVVFPSVGSLVLCGSANCTRAESAHEIQGVSVGISVALLLAYLAYLVFGVFGFESLHEREPEGRESKPVSRRAETEERAAWPLWLSIGLLVGATVVLIPVIDVLTGTVEMATRSLGWTDIFVGIIVVANAGNVAEAYAALKFAWQLPGTADAGAGRESGLDLALGIASASSIQIATFVAPLIVLYSLLGNPMNLVFSPVELAIFALLVLVFAYIAQDGESNWLEGAELLALYAMAAVIFYVLPVKVFGS